jgi:DNA-binding response OmpR family regulator
MTDSSAPATSTSANSKINILIVDDTPDNIRFLSDLLLHYGYSTRKAINGEMALTTVAVRLPDLILLDISMPGMDGYEVCQRLKANPATEAIPVIFLSAFDDVTDKVKAFQAGGVDYITKPFQFEEVLARIQNQLMIQQLQQKLKAQNTQLQQALSQLQATQAELLQKQQMASLGQLIAGVTTEIHNPINFIYGNMSHARDYAQSLLEALQLYQQRHQSDAEMEHVLDDLDVPFIAEDLPKLLDSLQVGAERIQHIARSLRVFCHLDAAAVKAVDLHEGLESSLIILQHRLRARTDRPEIAITKQYGDLPLVECYARQINQVFLNLISYVLNQFDASRPGPTAPNLTITTAALDAMTVQVQITGRGCMITPACDRADLLSLADAMTQSSTATLPSVDAQHANTLAMLDLISSYKIITEQHQGSFSCSMPCDGTIQMVFHLPTRLATPFQSTAPSPALSSQNA